MDLARLSLSRLSLWLKATNHGSEPDRTAHSSDGGYPTEYPSDVIGRCVLDGGCFHAFAVSVSIAEEALSGPTFLPPPAGVTLVDKLLRLSVTLA